METRKNKLEARGKMRPVEGMLSVRKDEEMAVVRLTVIKPKRNDKHREPRGRGRGGGESKGQSFIHKPTKTATLSGSTIDNNLHGGGSSDLDGEHSDEPIDGRPTILLNGQVVVNTIYGGDEVKEDKRCVCVRGHRYGCQTDEKKTSETKSYRRSCSIGLRRIRQRSGRCNCSAARDVNERRKKQSEHTHPRISYASRTFLSSRIRISVPSHFPLRPQLRRVSNVLVVTRRAKECRLVRHVERRDRERGVAIDSVPNNLIPPEIVLRTRPTRRSEKEEVIR